MPIGGACSRVAVGAVEVGRPACVERLNTGLFWSTGEFTTLDERIPPAYSGGTFAHSSARVTSRSINSVRLTSGLCKRLLLALSLPGVLKGTPGPNGRGLSGEAGKTSSFGVLRWTTWLLAIEETIGP